MKNAFELCADKAIIFLNRKGSLLPCFVNLGTFAIVSAIPFSWCAAESKTTTKPTHYAYYRNSADKIVLMHRMLFGFPAGLQIDHLNHNGLDNRLSNLRAVTRSVNLLNRSGPQANSTSGVRGISWDKSRSQWMAKIKLRGRTITIGRFPSKESAAQAVSDYRLSIGCLA